MLTTALLTGAGVVTGLLAGPALRRLPEPPAFSPDAEEKIPYRHLASPRFAVGVGTCSVAALLLVATQSNPLLWPVWLPLATVGILLAGIDAVTTWLPLRLTHALWWTAGLGLACAVVLSAPAGRSVLLTRSLAGAAVLTAFFWFFWFLTGGIGFGDVRLAPVLGATAASVSIDVAVAGLLAGTLLGALHGLVRRLRGRSGPFPYGPSLVIGVFAGLASAG